MITFIGNAHIDPAWMWRMDEGYDAFAATARSAIERMKENDDIFFAASSAALYDFIEQTDPELFRQIQESVSSGRWEIVGGWWVEPDCNLPAGESFIRHALYAQRYFNQKFGVQCSVGYCIDSFGHNANLPQLLRHGGLRYYVCMRPASDELPLDSPLFWWRSRSGDSILTYRIPFHYSNYLHSPEQKVQLLKAEHYYQRNDWMLFYGIGNHGGGPTKEQILAIRSLQNNDADLQFGRIDNYFQVVGSIKGIDTVRADLQRHAVGCYSAHSAIKKLNRSAENALVRAEKIASLCAINGVRSIEWHLFRSAWKSLLFNQFHDILGGVAIPTAMNDAQMQLNEALRTANEVVLRAVFALTSHYEWKEGGETLLIINPHPYQHRSPIAFELWNPEASEKGRYLEELSLVDTNGSKYAVQIIRSEGNIGGDRVGCMALVPLMPGVNIYYIIRDRSADTANPFKVDDERMNNGIISFSVNERTADLHYTPAAVYQDDSDTWGHGVSSFDKLIGEFTIRQTQMIESGPIRSCLRIISEYGASQIIEDISMNAGSDMIESRVRMFIAEKNVVVKLRFAHQLQSPTFITEIPYSFEERPTDGSEWYGHSFVHLEDQHSSRSLISDAKYSYSADEQFLYMTAARTVRAAYHHPPHPSDDDRIIDHLDMGEQQFRYVLTRGKRTVSTLFQQSAQWLQPPYVLYRSGTLASKPFLPITLIPSDSVQLETFKRAEDDNGWVIRLREISGEISAFQLMIGSYTCQNTLKPYEIVSYLFKNGTFFAINGLEQNI